MNEFNSINDEINNFICQGCLETKYNIIKVGNNLNLQFRKLLNLQCEVNISNDVYLCVFCVAQVKKIFKFIDQCTHINNIYFTQINKPLTSYCSLSQSGVVKHSYPDTEQDGHYVKIEVCDDDGQFDFDNGTVSDDEVPLISLKNEEFKIEQGLDVYDYNVKEEDTNHNHKEVLKKIQEEQLQSTAKRKKIPKKKKKTIETFDGKEKKILRDGFSSRMVQETEEYVVIKLSPEQVLEEMRVRAESNKYVWAPYKCDKCVLGFNHEDVLQNHMEKHSMKAGAVECEICSQYWPRGVSMRGHMKSHTTRYKCKVCAETYNGRQNVVEHYNNSHTSGGITYNCTQCSFYTCKRTVLQRHAQSHKTSLEYSCDKCGKTLKNKDSLRTHIARHDKTVRLKCPECGRGFSNPHLLEIHKATHAVSAEVFYCVECDVNFKSRVTLQSHFKRTKAHRNPELVVPHKCRVCGVSLESLALLAAHTLAAHGAAARPACPLCRLRFSSAAALRAHTRHKHSAYTRPVCTCHLCGHTFAGRSALTKHMRTHTGERPYACAECGLCFAQHGTRYTHIRIVHKKLPRSAKKVKEEQQALCGPQES